MIDYTCKFFRRDKIHLFLRLWYTNVYNHDIIEHYNCNQNIRTYNL